MFSTFWKDTRSRHQTLWLKVSSTSVVRHACDMTDLTSVKALGLEVPSQRLLATHGDLLRQQPAIRWQHFRRAAPVAPLPAQGAAAAPAQPDQPDQPDHPDQPDLTDHPIVDGPEDHAGPAGPPEAEPIDAENDEIPLLDGHGQSPTAEHGEAMKDAEPNRESGSK